MKTPRQARDRGPPHLQGLKAMEAQRTGMTEP
jgi:hypothetical protein